MAFADPQSITVNAVAQTMPRVETAGNRSVYSKDDSSYKLTVSHQLGKRNRRQIRLDAQKITADPLVASTNVKTNIAMYLVVDVPPNGTYTNAEVKLAVDGFLAYLTASSGAKITQLLGGEN